jgi:hypothetical protein
LLGFDWPVLAHKLIDFGFGGVVQREKIRPANLVAVVGRGHYGRGAEFHYSTAR